MLTFARPIWFWALLIIPLIPLVAWPVRRNLRRRRWYGMVVARCAVLLALVAILAEPQFVRRNEGVTVIFALDRSRSVPAELRQAAQEYVKRMSRLAKRDDRIGIVGFDGKADVDLPPRSSSPLVLPFGLPEEPDRTDLAAAVRLSMALFPGDTSRRIILLTDGNQNDESVKPELDMAGASGVAVDVVPLEYEARDEMLLDRLVAPAHAASSSRLQLRIVARSLHAARGQIKLYDNDVEVPLQESTIELRGGMQPDVVQVPIELFETGVHRFEARLSPAEGSRDTIAQNNRATAFTFVDGKSRVLVLGNPESSDDGVFVDALRREKVDVDYRGVDQASIDLVHLQQYSALVLSNISAEKFNETQHQALASYVKDIGGGLILLGGNEAFGAGGWIGKPVEEVSPVAFQLPSQKTLPVGALIIVLDHSGSMGMAVAGTQRTQQQVANDAAVLALGTLFSNDYVGLVAFDTQADWVVPLQLNTDPNSVAAHIRRIAPAGGTDSFPALEAAAKALWKLGDKAAIKHILLLTDGQMAPAPFEPLIQSMTKSGITLSTIGIGDAMNDPLLSKLAKLGGGSFHQVRNPRLLPQVFFRETKIMRKRLLSETPFTPKVVGVHSPLLTGVNGALPPLGGFVRTRPKPDALISVVHPGEKDMPILAQWQYKLGKVIVFTSGWWPQWGEHWAGWESFGAFWRRAVEWVSGSPDAKGFEVATRIDGTKGHVLVEALQNDVSYENGLTIKGVLVKPNYETQPILLSASGPGRYEATFNIHDSGDYLLNLQVADPAGKASIIRTGLSIPYSPEYRELKADAALLEEAARTTRGKIRSLTSTQDNVFERDLPPVQSRKPIWQWFLAWCLLPLFIIDVAVRRLASALALSLYIELAVFTMLVGIARLTAAGLSGYVLAAIIAEIIGWIIRAQTIVEIRNYFRRAAAGPAQAAMESVSVLKDSKRQLRDALYTSAPDSQTEKVAAKEMNELQSVDNPGVTVDENWPIAPDVTQKPATSKSASSAEPQAGQNLSDRLRSAKRRAQDRLAASADDAETDPERNKS